MIIKMIFKNTKCTKTNCSWPFLSRRLLPKILMSLLNILLMSSILLNAAEGKKVWRRVEAISGREAVLPCEVGLIQDGDMIYVVLWYLNGRKEPIYSYDNRPRGLQAAEDRHIIQSEELEGRVFFRLGNLPALHIKPVRSADQANYTCRVDFRIANSRTTHLTLRVVVPPATPTLRIGGKAVYKPVLGPLLEGQAFRISCFVDGGEPPPEVVWIKDELVIDYISEIQTISHTANQLMIPTLSRDFHDSRLTCKAFNNNITAPSLASLTITMNLRPLFTRIRTPPRQMRIGVTYEITCITAGSRPSPNVTWSLGNVASVIPIPAITEHSLNSSLSIARLTAIRRYHGQKLTCNVVNNVFPSHVESDFFLLNVTYPPVAAIELGRGASSVVKEGADVYFNCMVDSNPPIYKTRWYHENRLLVHSPENGIIISAHSLAIRGIKRSQGGHYVCSASNVEGDAKSSPLYLGVSYAPICNISEPPVRVAAAGIGQTINITCDVMASPKSVKYSWVFNNSVTSERVPGNQVYLTKEGKSVVRFTARTSQDYGTLQCWAENVVGRMTTPCYYHVLPAGRPDPPANCTVSNKTYVSLAVSCEPGFNGGMPQIFEAWVFESVTGRSQINESSKSPHLVLKGLTPGLDYVIHVTSRNAMGRSDVVRLEAFTYKMAENRMRKNQGKESDDPVGLSVGGADESSSGGITIALLAGVILLIGTSGILVFLLKTLIVRRRANEVERQFPPSSEQERLSPSTESGSLRVKGRSNSEDRLETSMEIDGLTMDTHASGFHIEDQSL